ncbi:nitrite/sulfite reductase [Anaeromyxobacter sp. SG64]|uniref:nitrite/sulfite reductase n=1 Tax=Anaeromyxobacter sp. SG64 TaxID=2925409 RepID=UPI001F586950|nr:nitrite/sulfite reductase [Anaeromyxobacter sp. SG64]
MSRPSEPTPPVRETFADDREIDAFVETLGRFERGEIDADAWRAYRVVRGAYSQRQDGLHMLRIKLPQGATSAAQLRALADVAARFSRGYGHVTTRQNFQVHFVRPADLEPALRRLAADGVTTSGAGGNAVRNVVACPLAGVSPDELFDVTPYAEAATRHFLRHPLANALPRKFKIAFEGCAEDHVATAIHDLGFRARVRTEGGRTVRGFSVTVAGGTASLCTSGAPLVDFLPASELLALAEAIVRVFHARGDRVNKQRNRLKFLVRSLGFEPFRALVEEELARVRAEGAPRLPFDPDAAPADAPPPAHARPEPPTAAEISARVAAAPPRGPGEPPAVLPVLAPSPAALAAFRATNVRPQRQPGFSAVTVSLPQGDVTAAQLEVLADLALAHGDGAVRFASDGKVLLRWVPSDEVPALFARLAAAGLGRDGARSAADVVACPGADVCRLAVTRTRGIARLVEERVRQRLGAPGLAAALPVHVSGCPNGCSQHHLAAIGLQGSARKLGGRAVPQYFVLVGGGAEDGVATFGKLAGKVPARRVPEAVERLTALYLAERREGEAAGPFFSRALDRVKAVVAPLEALRLEDAAPEDFVEPGASDDFSPETQAGECAA